MIKLGIVVGSTRPGRRAPIVADWVAGTAKQHSAVLANEAGVEIVDIADFSLPLLDEPVPAIRGDYRHAHTKAWSAAIASCDGFIFVTPEYNHSFSAALKNAVDFLYAEWNDKAAGFVGYGGLGGVRAVEQLRTMLAEVKIATVRTQVLLSKYSDKTLFTDPDAWTGSVEQERLLATMLDEIIAWSRALRTVRQPAVE